MQLGLESGGFKRQTSKIVYFNLTGAYCLLLCLIETGGILAVYSGVCISKKFNPLMIIIIIGI